MKQNHKARIRMDSLLAGRRRSVFLIGLSLMVLVLAGCGAHPYVEIRGTVYHDVNRNDMRDAGDTPMAGVEVSFTNADEFTEGIDIITVTTQTDAEGTYSFVVNSMETYPGGYLTFSPPEGMTLAGFDRADDDLLDSDVAISEEHFGKALLEFGKVINMQLLIDALMVDE